MEKMDQERYNCLFDYEYDFMIFTTMAIFDG